nr:C40 family peptidase [uncultured Clostridium sp.]
MAGKRFEARDKRVQKMSRDGLTEENLRSGEKRKISTRTQDDSFSPKAAGHFEPEFHAGKAPMQEEAVKKHRHRQRGQETPITETGQIGVTDDFGQPASQQAPEWRSQSEVSQEARPQEWHSETGKTDISSDWMAQERPLGERERHPFELQQGASGFQEEQPKRRNRKQVQDFAKSTGEEAAHKESSPVDSPEKSSRKEVFQKGGTEMYQPLEEDLTRKPVESEQPETELTQETVTGGNEAEIASALDGGRVSNQSARMQAVREGSLASSVLQTAVEKRHARNKKQVQTYHQKQEKESAKAEVFDTDDAPTGDAHTTKESPKDYENVAESPKGEETPTPSGEQKAGKPRESREAQSSRSEAFRHQHDGERLSEGDGKYADRLKPEPDTPARRLRETSEEKTDLSDFKEDIKRKGKKERLNQEQRKKAGRLSFGDEGNGMVRGAGMGMVKKAATAAAGAVTGYAHTKVHSAEKENSAVEGAHKAEILEEREAKKAYHQIRQHRKTSKASKRREGDTGKKSGRLQFSSAEQAEKAASAAKKADTAAAGKQVVKEAEEKKRLMRKFWQKKRYKEAYAAAKKGEKTTKAAAHATRTMGQKAKSAAQAIIRKSRGIFIAAGIMGLIIIAMGAIFSSCAAMFQAPQNTFVATTYPSTDEAIRAVEADYAALEAALNAQINNMETTHPGYDEYNYQIDEISHNPYQLISYLTVRYGEFTYDQVDAYLQTLFSEQYTLNVQEVVETRTRTETRTGTRTHTDPETGLITEEEYEYEVEVEYDYYILNISLVNRGLDMTVRNNMTSDEASLYALYNTTYGNRDYLFDTSALPTYNGSGGFGYDIPAEALSDERFARMIGEAERYLGYPYVWGGSSPSTSFDCSGFVCWVINNCGNGWNVGRTTAEGLRSCCAYVSPSEARPGDIIFFQGTYNTAGASHVGIYVGNGMMIHCGSPIQYTSIESSYWQSHFMAFGRLP